MSVISCKVFYISKTSLKKKENKNLPVAQNQVCFPIKQWIRDIRAASPKIIGFRHFKCQTVIDSDWTLPSSRWVIGLKDFWKHWAVFSSSLIFLSRQCIIYIHLMRLLWHWMTPDASVAGQLVDSLILRTWRSRVSCFGLLMILHKQALTSVILGMEVSHFRTAGSWRRILFLFSFSFFIYKTLQEYDVQYNNADFIV